MLAGTGNAAALLDNMMLAPPDGARALSVIVKVAVAPPDMLDGVIATLESNGSTTGATVAVAILLVEL
jgi:hypothetical protein